MYMCARAWQPFGFAGKRGCPGIHYAYAEAVAVVATLARGFTWTLADGATEVPAQDFGLVTRPRGHARLLLRRRARRGGGVVADGAAR